MTSKNDDYNDDELVAPNWLNDVFFQGVLRNIYGNCELQITSITFSPASLKGDHFASVVFRCQVVYELNDENKVKSLFIKTMPEMKGAKMDVIGESKLFETEIAMYTEVLPRFEGILRAVEDSTELKTSCLFHSLTPKKCIVLEDLVSLGYTVVRDRPLNEIEVDSIFSKLAKWHAISYKINLEQPELLNKFKPVAMDMPSSLDSDFMRSGIANFIELLKDTPSLRYYVSYFEALKPSLIAKVLSSYTEYFKAPQPDAYYVLCYGDIHSKNLMVKNDPKTGEFLDVMLLDFQACYMGPIVNDLIYAYFLILDGDLRRKRAAVFNAYFETFLGTLKRIGFTGPMPQTEKFRDQFLRHKHFELFLFVTYLPIFTALSQNKIDIGEIMTSAEVRRKSYRSGKFLKIVEWLLPEYLSAGYFADLDIKSSCD